MLVICDYVTRNLEAIPLKHIDLSIVTYPSNMHCHQYHPQNDDLVECFNQVIKTMLGKVATKKTMHD